MKLQGKKILLGVCGSIAAYKSALLTRLLIKSGAEVQVLLTPSALDFITPLTLATLSKRPALTEFVKNEAGEWNNHVDLGLWADLMIIAPASANTLAKMATGQCDNLLLATYLSARCPVMVAPAMDLDMYLHPSTQKNLQSISDFGTIIIQPEHGELASGLVGTGRMAEPEQILEHIERFFTQKLPLQGKKALVTAGPTYEAIDPVRFIGNHSTGKMGYQLAEALRQQGAEVTLISGPSQLENPHPAIELVRVQSAQQMFDECQKRHHLNQIMVFAAAVADYKPEVAATQKIKKEEGITPTIELEKTIDIAATLGRTKKQGQWHIGFALETHQEEQNAQKKLENKNFDMIVLNSLNDQGAGFGHNTNKISIIKSTGPTQKFDLKSKKEVAHDIVNQIISLIHE